MEQQHFQRAGSGRGANKAADAASGSAKGHQLGGALPAAKSSSYHRGARASKRAMELQTRRKSVIIVKKEEIITQESPELGVRDSPRAHGRNAQNGQPASERNSPCIDMTFNEIPLSQVPDTAQLLFPQVARPGDKGAQPQSLIQ